MAAKKACERYQNLSEEGKEKCGCQRYEDVPWHEKQMLLKKSIMKFLKFTFNSFSNHF